MYTGGGLEDFDAQDAADAFDFLNKEKAQPPAAPPLPDTQPPPFDPAAPPADATAAAPLPGPPSAQPAGPDGTVPPPIPPAQVSTVDTSPSPKPQVPAVFPPLGPPPPRPKLTGDPTKDNQSNLEWSQQLQDYQADLAKHQAAIAAGNDDIAQRRAERQADAEREEATARQAKAAAFQAQQQARQQQVDDAVKEKQAAYADLKNPEGTSFADKLGAALAIALGGVGQGLMLKGHVAGAQNEGLIAVNKGIEQDHQRKLERLKSAGEAVMEARYGFKDAADNQRAAMNDLDADRAAKYRLIAAEAEEQLRAQGVGEAEIKSNAVVLNALQEAAKSTDAITAREEQRGIERDKNTREIKALDNEIDYRNRTLSATTADRRERASEHRDEFNLKRQDQLARDEDRKAANAEKATVGSVRQNAVLGNLAEAEKAAKDIGPVSEAAINKLQTNREQSKAAEHAATSGITGNLLARAGRATGTVARGPYDGIPPEEQKKITAAEQVITHLTEMQQGKNIETLEQYRDRYSPYVPGLSADEVRRREAALPGLVAEQRAIQDPQGTGTKRQTKAEPQTDAEQAREHLSKSAPKAKASKLSGQDAQAKDWADANPDDPRAAKIRQRLGL